ncbi:MAG: endopeptidase La [Ignavibacteria bacterium]|nr:endopeptidase La [Ignavibacteria bacterium]
MTEKESPELKDPGENAGELIYDNLVEKQYNSAGKKEISDFKFDSLPVVPLKDTVIFPYMLYPVLVGRRSTVNAVNYALEKEKFVFLAAQVDSSIEETLTSNLYATGTVARVLQVIRLPNGLIKVLVDGLMPARVIRYENNSFIKANIEVINQSTESTPELEALIKEASEYFENYIKANPQIPKDSLSAYENIKEPDRKLYYIASTLNVEVSKKQNILNNSDLKAQYLELLYLLSYEHEISKIVREIENKITSAMQQNQRRYIIQEQIRILQEELGDGYETDPDLIKIKGQIEKAGMPEQVLKKAMDEFNKLRKTPTMSPDFGVIRNYLDWMVNVPWNVFTEDNFNLDNAERILDEDHYDLEKPKQRILELIAVLKLLKEKDIKKPPKGQILCLVGPPGVGKTSLGRSIARALNRKFTRLSVGGVRDEAEIRGHRRTYIGSMPGRIIQAMKKTGTCNPVVLIDEIDKMGSDFRGDPASAMLEVLDPEQNNTFNDHYLDIDYDLSNVLFITTANVQYNIPFALQDRMEIIEMRSYLDFEKVQIAKRHIIPKEIKEHGLDKDDIKFKDKIVYKIIRNYTREAGVRNMERELSSIIRKVARDRVAKKIVDKITVSEKMVEEYLGVPKYKEKSAGKDEKTKVGSVYGLAWTSMGGDILNVDVTVMKGNNKLTLTGKLGEVMKESASAGLSYIKSNSALFGIPENYFKDKEVHIHLPEGAIPKDGPSAGITMIMAMLSAITKNPARTDVAMTGEITLRGNVLSVGGLNEKLLAALRSGIKTVLIPEENEKNLTEVSEDIIKKLKIVSIKKVDEGIEYVFGRKKISFMK